MSSMLVAGDVKEASIRAVVRNADGTIKQDLGVVSYYHRNPLRRLLWRARKWMEGLNNGRASTE